VITGAHQQRKAGAEHTAVSVVAGTKVSRLRCAFVSAHSKTARFPEDFAPAQVQR
jgi:hypothetical protein